jgi:UDPglucose 6-dehydrogenase
MAQKGWGDQSTNPSRGRVMINNGHPLRISVIGIGYLGLTHAVCMADLGHEVLAIDSDPEKLSKAAVGEVPFFEPGLEPLLQKNLETGRLRFTDSFAEVADFGDVHFLCVNTPQGPGGQADLTHLHAAADMLAPLLSRRCVVVGKSTVPVGTARQLLARLRSNSPAGELIDLVWNPEFLREGFAVQDSLSPDRIVLGVTQDESAEVLRQVYAAPVAAGSPVLIMDFETAELVKVSANAFLATKISFINVIAEMCEAASADVVALADALGYDQRIGRRFLGPGLGFGGGCLPKDIRALAVAAEMHGVNSLADLLSTVDVINQGRRNRVVAIARAALGGSLSGARIGVLGVAFKPHSDDIRDSPSLDVCSQLTAEGAIVAVHDPVAAAKAAEKHPQLRSAASVLEACRDADLVLHLTEWPEYQAIDPAVVAQVVSSPVLVDARCALDAAQWRDANWTVHVLGRPNQPA